MKHWKTYFWIVTLIGVLVFAAKARAQDIQRMEFYPGINRAVAETLMQNVAPRAQSYERGSGFKLLSSRFFPCDNESLSVNVWLVSKHESKSRNKELQEKNRGVGMFYSCDGWSTGFDRMINSNNGQATVLSLLWGPKPLEVGPVLLGGKAGFARVSYGVPKYNVTLYENTKIGFLTVGMKRWPQFSLNIAPVPKVAGDAYIAWVSYKFMSLK